MPVSWYDELARILTKVEDFGVWPDGLLDAYIAMIPKTDGDSTPLGQRPLSVLPIVYRIWASGRIVQLEDWFRSWVPDSVFSAGVVEVRLRLGILLLLKLKRALTFISLLLVSSSLLILLHGNSQRSRRVRGWRTSLRRRCVAQRQMVSAPPLKGGSGAV